MPGSVICAVSGISENGPAAAVTPCACAVAASCGTVATVVSAVAVTLAPCCAANARSNGLLESASMARARVEAAVEASATRPMMTAWSLRPPRPPRAARMIAFMTAPFLALLLMILT